LRIDPEILTDTARRVFLYLSVTRHFRFLTGLRINPDRVAGAFAFYDRAMLA